MKNLRLVIPFISLFFLSTQAFANFEAWKKDFTTRSAKKGLPAKFVAKQLKDVKYLPKIIDRDRNQITSNKKVEYKPWIKKWLGTNSVRVKKGKALMKRHAKLLNDIEKKYQVDKEVIISLWGVETLYGKITGNHKIIPALATLAYDKRRRTFFEGELFAALKIVHEGHISADKFLGSWAGALGQCQFMPTSFLRYAQDYDGDGKKDIWSNHSDIFASIAYYLKSVGWEKGKSIGNLAVPTKNADFNLKRSRSPAQYTKLGLRSVDGSKLSGSWRRKAVKIPFQNSPLLLKGTNYASVMRWNRSSLFAALNIILMDSLKR